MLKEIDLTQLKINPFTEIGKEWMLISAGDKQKYNMMTASWGGFGVMWNKNVSTIVIRPQRYTLEFVENKDYYALNFFDQKYKSALSYCGAHSGRDVNKEKETGLTPIFDAQAPYFSEAKLVLICHKLFKQKLDPNGFIDKNIDKHWYPEKDYHECFVGEIIKVLINEN
ncbi:NADH-FMN oxidoreductase RutF, flavin reductase (DIM6/NTAB) family [Clostridium sp. USBA 49]|jgi:flavin reductase (DIM6/NTAB) family NADH-FMN oxidoreductase RutF|uniref:flavin reductase n=1 Tax=Clostridium TaxID=1485 RepID=UPI000999D159|nr:MULTISPECIES: flavin reductase [Clostridium]SKA85485.1 NADH-FMN oxidoreductase RutF, flavin reductase (DIM6/NTAB) family [Clostridium sp. USBA 49]